MNVKKILANLAAVSTSTECKSRSWLQSLSTATFLLLFMLPAALHASVTGTTVKMTEAGNPGNTYLAAENVGPGVELDDGGGITVDVDPNTSKITITIPTASSPPNFDLVFAGGTLTAFTGITLNVGQTTVTDMGTLNATFSGKTLTVNLSFTTNGGNIVFDFTSSAGNTNPDVTGLPATRSFTEDTQASFDISASAFSDAESPNITVTLTASAGTFGLAASGSVTLGGNGTGTITIAGTPANVNTYLDTPSNVTYTPASNANGSPAATVAVTANDGEGSGNVALGTINVNVTAVNDAPTFTGGATLSAVNEDTSAPAGATITSLLNANFSDVDTGNTFAGVAVTASAANSGTEGKWQYSTDSGSSWFDVGSVSTSAALLLSSTTTLRFLPVANFNGTPGALTIFAVDNSAATTFTSGSTRQTFDTTADNLTSKVAATGVALGTSITSVNDAPTLTATGGNPTFAQGGSAVDLLNTVTASTVDAGQSFSAFTLTVTNISNGANEVLSIGGTSVALVNGNSGTVAGIGNFNVSVFGSTATVSVTGMTRDNSQMGTLVDGITYQNTATPPATTARVITITGIEDNGGTANGGVDSATVSLASTVSIDLAPTVSGRTVPANGTYKTGDNLDFTVTWSENVTVDTGGGTPYITLTLSTGGSVQAAYQSGSTTSTLTFRYTVASGNADSDGIVVASSITLNGSTIRDSGSANAPLTSLGFGSTAAVLVDGVAPTVSSINRQSPSSSTTNATAVTYRLTFAEGVTGVDTGDFTLTMAGTASGSVASVSAVSASVYDVTVNTISGDGVLRLDLNNSGTGISDSSANAIATGYTSGQTYAVDNTASTVTSVSVPANATYIASQNLDFTVNFGENMIVDTSGGTPTISLTIGSTSRSATYLSGSGTTALVFRYTISTGEVDSDGITVGSLALNTGTIRDTAGNDATLTLNSVGSTAAVLVDASAPVVTGSIVPVADTYKVGDHLDFSVEYSENVTVNTGGGTPYIALTLDTGGSVQAAYNSGSGTNTLTFRYTVASGNADSNGITASSSITLNGGTIRDAVGNNAQITGISFCSTASVLVDGIVPTVNSINRQTPSSASTSATSIAYRATFAEAVTGVDSSDFQLTTTGSASGTIASLSTVSASVYDITVNTITGSGTLRLDLKNAGTGIEDSANNAIAAGYTSGQVYTIDTTAPTLPAANIVVNNQTDPHKVVLTFSEALDSATLGAASAWTATANSGTPAYSIASVGLSSGNIVTLTLVAVDISNNATKITNTAANAHLKITPPATLTDAGGNSYAAGLVTEAGATHVLDTTAPTLSAVSATASTAIAGTLNATASEKVRGYWIAVAAAATAPSVAQVKAAVNYGAVTIVASGSGALPASASSLALSGLTPVSSYDLYLVADDAAGNATAAASSATWTPLIAAPTATTGAATGITETGATLNGTVNDNGQNTTVSFNYGATTAYGTTAAATTGGTITAGAGSSAASVSISGLVCGTSYHFRVSGVNATGTTNGSDATFTTSSCVVAQPNPFNPAGTQATTGLDTSTGVVPTKAPSDIITNLDKLDSRVGISDNGIVVVLDNGIKEPVKFRDNPPDNVLISMPSQKPLDVQLNGNTMNIQIDPETPNPPKQTILSTTTLQLPDGSQAKGLQLVQGEAVIRNEEPHSTLGGLQLSQDVTLRGVVAQAGPEGGSVGFKKMSDGSGSVSAESGEIVITVRLKGSGISTLTQASTLPGFVLTAQAIASGALELTLKAGEVARFDKHGELQGVYLGSLSGTKGKTGDALTLTKPSNVSDYPATTLLFEGYNVPSRLGVLFSDFMNARLAGSLQLKQRSDGLMEVTSANGGKYYAFAVNNFEVVPNAADGTTANIDGSVSLTFGGIRSTWQPILENAGDVAEFFVTSSGMMTDVLDDGLVQVSGGSASNRFFVARPRFMLLSDAIATRGLTSAGTGLASLFYTNAKGQKQQLDPAFLDVEQIQVAAAMQGWTLTRVGNDLFVKAPTGESYRLIPDARVDMLDAASAPSGVFRKEGGKLYFYYSDEPLRQGFTLQAK